MPSINKGSSGTVRQTNVKHNTSKNRSSNIKNKNKNSTTGGRGG